MAADDVLLGGAMAEVVVAGADMALCVALIVKT
jgi:hypothetical protein